MSGTLYSEYAITRPRWFTQDRKRARDSIFQWSTPEENGSSNHYSLSILGAINGLLPEIPIWHPVLCVVTNAGREIVGWQIRRRWWPTNDN